jgi:hypothetical protein
MRIVERRRLDAVLFGAAALLVGGAALAGAANADDERVTGLWAGAQVERDGGARVVEAIDYDFGIQRRHGIFRDVPGLDRDRPVQVSSASAPAQVEATGTAVQTRLRIGDPARTIGGRHRYTVVYHLGGVAPEGRLAWDAVGTSWPVDLAEVEIHVVAPYRLRAARCVQGEAGAQEPCPVTQPEPGHLVATVDHLAPGEGVTVYASAGLGLAAPPALPAPPAGVPADPGTGLVPPALVAVLAALLGTVPARWLVRRAGRERVARGGAAEAAFAGTDGSGAGRGRPGPELLLDPADLDRLATTEFAPPGELTPAQGGVVLAEVVRPEHKVAWLIGAAIDGYIDLEAEGRGPVTLVRLPRRQGPASYLLDTAFDGRDRLTLGSYDPGFAAAWRSVGNELGAWQRASGLWDPRGDDRRTLARVLGVAAGVAGLALTALAGGLASRWGPGWLVLVAVGGLVAGAGAAGVIGAWELRVRTAAGSALWLRTESFRRFLAASEAHHAEEAAKRGHLREYTAWAVAVGELDRWSSAVAASSTAVADPVAARYPLLAPALLSETSTSSERPSSSGSGGGGGGGGGGGVGGGAGGGGGGSW